jgi:hypothetical protein
MTGTPKAGADRIRGIFRHPTDKHHIAYGVGIVVGCGCSTLTVSETWMSLSDTKIGRTLESLTAFINGYAESKEDPRAIWSARLVRQLSHRQQDTK